MTLRLAALVTILSLALAHMRAQTEIHPNDPLFRFQKSFFAKAGEDSLRMASVRSDTKAIRVAADVTLDIQRGWAITTGSNKVIVAVLDDGFFYGHEDIRDNVWNNPGESGTDAKGMAKTSNGVDDDDNGFVDDVMGWDFAFEDPDPDPYVFDGMDRNRIQPYWHSIHALGIIGARGNNGIGIAGINWNVSMMLLKIGAQGTRSGEIDSMRTRRAIRALHYAADNGARVINWSGYVGDRDPRLLDELRSAIEYAGTKSVLVVIGAGNDGKGNDDPSTQLYPQRFECDNLLAVAEVDFSGRLYEYSAGGKKRGSNWGPRHVHLGAIGENYSTGLRQNVSTYELTGGTSNAAPVVTGVAALILSIRPDLSPKQIKEILMKTATPSPHLKNRVQSGGIVNAFHALTLARRYPK